MSEFLSNYDFKKWVKDKAYFKSPENPRCIDLFITNSSGSFQNTTTVVKGLSDVHKMIVAICKYSFKNLNIKQLLIRTTKNFDINIFKIVYMNYKNFDLNTFKNILWLKLQNIKNYHPFEQVS